MSNAICFYDDSVKNLVNRKTNDPNLKVLIDHACVFDDNYENSFAWLVETPLMLHALAYYTSRGKIADWGVYTKSYQAKTINLIRCILVIKVT